MKLLVAEDEKKLRVLIRDFFEIKGYEVIEAEDGLQAIDAVKKHTVDAISAELRYL